MIKKEKVTKREAKQNRIVLARLEKEAKSYGADLFGAADLSDLAPDEILLDPVILKRLPLAISLGVRLSTAVLSTLTDGPNRLYFHHYRSLNHFLDSVALRATNLIQTLGGQALPIAASQVVDWQKQKGHLSHKKIAQLAGLGWLGRNNLLVTPQFGSQVRLVTILTDLPLAVGRPLTQDCGSCRACLDICPAQAIKEKPEDFDHQACYEKLKQFRSRGLTDQFICGLCQKACLQRS